MAARDGAGAWAIYGWRKLPPISSCLGASAITSYRIIFTKPLGPVAGLARVGLDPAPVACSSDIRGRTGDRASGSRTAGILSRWPHSAYRWRRQPTGEDGKLLLNAVKDLAARQPTGRGADTAELGPCRWGQRPPTCGGESKLHHGYR